MDNTPDYTNNLAFAPGDWSDSRVNGNTDRTASTIQLIEKIEQLEKENKKLRDAIEFQSEFINFVWKESKDILLAVQIALLKMEQEDDENI